MVAFNLDFVGRILTQIFKERGSLRGFSLLRDNVVISRFYIEIAGGMIKPYSFLSHLRVIQLRELDFENFNSTTMVE